MLPAMSWLQERTLVFFDLNNRKAEFRNRKIQNFPLSFSEPCRKEKGDGITRKS